jgi:peptide/nickel transport system permease protein
MAKLIAYRLLLAVPQLIIVTVLAFSLTYLIPGSPAAAILGVSATPESVAALETQLGLDEPAPTRLVNYLGDAARGDFGESYRLQRPVTDLVLERMPATLSMVAAGVFVALLIGVTMGILAGTKPDSSRDKVVMGGSAVAVAVPQFWLGLLLLLVFSIRLGWIPVVAYTPLTDNPIHWARGMILPSLSLGIAASVLIARQTRAGMARALHSNYADSLSAIGMSRGRFTVRYGLKNAMVPVLAATGLTFTILVGASFGIERVFSVPGVGSLMLASVTGKDYPVVQGGVVLIAVMVIILNILIDVGYGLINPRTRPQ